ncbi:MAG: hypothetical protein OEZ59_09900, partial [Deltaproteobacteria bacterium]|nr:hypothetical protein [Deltaproteobacteria bacterium]
PHRINSSYRHHANRIITSINGVPLNSLQDIERGLKATGDGYHRFVLDPGGWLMVLDSKEADESHDQILQAYGIRQDRRLK